jgi:hypothetical protein
MIIVKVELHSARTGKITELGRMHVSNDCTSTDFSRGNYNVEVFRRGSTSRVNRRGRVYDFPRHSYSIWRLISRAIRSAFPEEK